MKKILENLFGVRRATHLSSRTPIRRPQGNRMAVEQLPDRIVPAIMVTVDAIAGDLTVISDAASDTIALTRDATGNIYVNGQTYFGAHVGITNNINIYGQGGNDTIDVSGVYGYAGSSFLNGGDGHDTLVGGSGHDGLFGFTGNDTLKVSAGNDTYNGGDDSDTLVGASFAPNTFNVNGLNAGTVGNARPFTAVKNLRGGSDRDVFAFAPSGFLTGTVDGRGGGNDFFDYRQRSTGVYVNFTTAFATSVGGGFSNVENVLGSQGDDILVGDALSNVLVGYAGDDRLYGGLGRDVLIGGDGIDSVRGQGDDDLMVGARTVFDNNVAALTNIQNTWAAGGGSLLTYAHVINDFDSDTLEGGPGFDVILWNPGDTVLP